MNKPVANLCGLEKGEKYFLLYYMRGMILHVEKEISMSTSQSWGETYYSHPHSEDYCCPGCGWDWLGDQEYCRFVVGFSTALAVEASFLREEKAGGVVIECKACFQKFWFHATPAMVRALRLVIEQWPKDVAE